MALILPNTETTAIATINGDKIDLGYTVGEVLPQLVIPSFIQSASNTSGIIPDSWQAMRFYQLAKTTATLTYKNGNMVVDPASIKSKNLEVEPVQLTPCQIAEKLTIKEMDLFAPRLNESLSKAIGSWILEQRIQLEIAILNLLVSSAKKVQSKLQKVDVDATTIAKGAHFAINNLDTFENAKKEFWNAVTNFTRIGLPNSKTTFDANNKFATGILLTDVLCLCSYEFLNTITSDKALLANSIGYNEIFKNMGVRQILGVNVLPVQTMPTGVNFILINTGAYGTFAYSSIADGLTINVIQDPNWSKHVRADLQYKYIAGIVNEQYSIVSVNDEFVETPNLLISNQVKLSNPLDKIAESFSEEQIQTVLNNAYDELNASTKKSAKTATAKTATAKTDTKPATTEDKTDSK